MVEMNCKQLGINLTQQVSPSGEFTVITRVLSIPVSKKLSEIPLRSIFPVLGDASVVESDRKFLLKQFNARNQRTAGMLAFDTRHHGRVYVICVSCQTDNVVHLAADRGNSSEKIERLSNDELVVLIENKTKTPRPDNLVLTMLVPVKGCEMCQSVGGKMLKCGGCWKDGQFPVRYCCKHCQVSDFPRHKAFCGKKLENLKPLPVRMPGSSMYFELLDKWAC